MIKLSARKDLTALCSQLRKEKRVIGYTSGVFDLLHAGHVDYLEKARAQCDFLIAGVNSDASVRTLKGVKRPVISEDQRATVLAALSCIDSVFVFDEANNNKNIELLKPDIYFKAGDYEVSKLSSAKIVQAYGGRVSIIPALEGLSTSTIIDRIVERFGEQYPQLVSSVKYEKAPAVFLDRDGTINEHVEYLHEPEKFKLIPGVFEGIKKFQDAGYRIVIVTNQAGIGLGYFSREDFYRVNKELLKAASKAGVNIDRVYFSPYSKADGTNCRKPATGMIDKALNDLNLDLKGSVVIGDMTSDILLGKNAGCYTILVKTGMKGEDGIYQVEPDYVAGSLLEAADHFLTKDR